MDHIPTPKIDRSREIERLARVKDVTDRARAASPVTHGADRLDRLPSLGRLV